MRSRAITAITRDHVRPVPSLARIWHLCQLCDGPCRIKYYVVLLLFSVWNWLERLGGLGLILLGFVDNSPIPVPGSMDALTLILSAHQKDWWWYYALMATIGGVAGAYAAYALGYEGGKEGLEKKLPPQKAKKIYSAFDKYGFWSLFVPALLPPPVPFSPFPITAGALKYPRHKFLAAVGLARGIRYGALAYLASSYSRQIFGFFHKYYQPIFWTLIVLAVIGGVVAGFYIWKRKKEGKPLLPGRARNQPAKAS